MAIVCASYTHVSKEKYFILQTDVAFVKVQNKYKKPCKS
jgi:hypothetical protein